jgi:hypothetical protein
MPIHDWTRVEAGIFHHFHHGWIEEIARALNKGLLPDDYYAMAEQHAAGYGPDVLTLQTLGNGNGDGDATPLHSPTGDSPNVLVAAPKVQLTAETDMEYYRRKQTTVAVRHVSGDRIVAMVEVVSPGNKSSRHSLQSFVDKTVELLDKQIHLLILDLHPPGRRDPQGIHATIWEEMTDQQYALPPGKPLTLAAYEAGLSLRAYVQATAVGDSLTDMPLFLKPGAHVSLSLEATYQAAFAAVPRRWRSVLEGPAV